MRKSSCNKGYSKICTVYVGIALIDYILDYPLLINQVSNQVDDFSVNLNGRSSVIKTATKYISLDWKVRSESESRVLDELLVGLKRFVNLCAHRTYKNAMSCLIANLRYCSQGGMDLTLLYNRGERSENSKNTRSNPKKINPRVVNKCVDYLNQVGMVVATTGNNNSYNGVASSIKITSLLSYKLQKEKVAIGLVSGAILIKLKSFKTKGNNPKEAKEISLPKTARGKQTVKALSKPVEDYHKCWLSHTAFIGKRQLIPFCYRVFNNESLELGGRFHGAEHQQLSKVNRASILIDGGETVEPDYKSLHYCLLYWMVGIQLDPNKNDPYVIDGFDRKTIKIAMLTLVNISTAKAFKANITKSGNPKNKQAYELYKADTNPDKRKLNALKGFIERMPDGINGGDLYKAICLKHQAIAHLFCTQDIGLKLQFIDSQIMARILSLLSEKDVPALSVHDSIIVRKKNLEVTKQVMIVAYKEETNGFIPVID
jgi:hypothetical protein